MRVCTPWVRPYPVALIASSVGGGDEMAGRCCRGVQRDRQAPDAETLLLHRRHMALDDVLGVGVDHRTDVSCQITRVADLELLRRALQHLEQPIGAIVLHAQKPQRRAALTAAIKSRGHDVGHCLLG